MSHKLCLLACMRVNIIWSLDHVTATNIWMMLGTLLEKINTVHYRDGSEARIVYGILIKTTHTHKDHTLVVNSNLLGGLLFRISVFLQKCSTCINKDMLRIY